MTSRKLKISVSIDAELVGAVDRLAAREGSTRSAVMERWLFQASRRARLARLAEETAVYYEAMTSAERADDAAWSNAVQASTRRLKIDDPKRASPKRSSSPSRRSRRGDRE
jgi:predicted transcriptional regulator